jgi:hypothetical protein
MHESNMGRSGEEGKLRLAGGILLAVALAGCDVVYDYPDRAPEDSAARCANGQDDDLDGLVDCRDPDCSGQCQENTAERCGNEDDDDLDGRADCFDPKCSAFCAENTEKRCSNGIDDDGNSKKDCGDPGCQVFDFCREDTAAACHDGKDEDADGATDCADPGCADFCHEDTYELCHNDADDDGDGSKDCGDKDSCGVFCTEKDEARCTDGEDNDQDGAIDCADDGCGPLMACREDSAQECGDGVDNDFDGKVDCDDDSCDGLCPEETEDRCTDHRDNDKDGLIDAADPRCWLVGAPVLTRCASRPSVRVKSGFEDDSTWFPFGPIVYDPNGNEGSVATRQLPEDRPGRTDLAVSFSPIEGLFSDGLYSSPPAGLVGGPANAGRWDGFELAFSARVVEHSMAEVSLYPTSITGSGAPIPDDIESKIVGVRLDARSAPYTLSLFVDGKLVVAALELPAGGALCTGTYCDGGWFRVTMRAEGERVVVRAIGADTYTVEGPRPVTSTIPLSQIVVRGISASKPFGSGLAGIGLNYNAYIDDVALTLSEDEPCGNSTPQLPFADAPYCDAAAVGILKDSGSSVAVSVAASGICAVLTEAIVGADPSAFTSYRSTDGIAWDGPPVTSGGAAGNGGGAGSGGISGNGSGGASGAAGAAGSSVAGAFHAVPSGAIALGAGVAFDPEAKAFRAVLAWKTATDVRYAVTRSADCSSWEAPVDAFAAPLDAEAPSYLIADGAHQILFTRAANDQTGRTLWRIVSTDGGSSFPGEPTAVAEFPSELFVAAPVAITKLGARDIVATYPLLPVSGTPGLGVMVAKDSSLGHWEATTSWPVIRPSGDGARFDGLELPAGSIGWVNEKRGFLLYGGRGGRFALGLGDGTVYQPLSAGTATLSSAARTHKLPGGSGGSGGTKAPPICGDGSCQKTEGESCSSCEIDCGCDGTTLLQERVDDPTTWQLLVPAGGGIGVSIDRESDVLQVGPRNLVGPTTAAVGRALRSLGANLEGDFEVEASMWVDQSLQGCSFAVGVGRGDELLSAPGVTATGVYAVFVPQLGCTGAPFSVVPVGGKGQLVPKSTICAGAGVPWFGQRYTLRLRRQGGTVAVSLRDPEGCASPANGPTSMKYSGAMPSLDTLVVAALGSGCKYWPIRLDDFIVRRLGDPASCPASTVVCSGVCADTTSTPEHCGACGVACEAGKTCTAGTCVCNGTTQCDDGCFDLSTDAQHCGDCAKSCGETEQCVVGGCQPIPGCTKVCNGACVDTQVNPNHCGDCGKTCNEGLCEKGACTCPAGFSMCAGGCKETQFDPTNCGGCGTTCAAAQHCTAGKCEGETCVPPCNPGETCAFGVCVLAKPGDVCATAIPVPDGGGVVPVELSQYAADYPLCSPTVAHDAAFSWTPSASGKALIDASTSVPDPGLTVSIGTDPACLAPAMPGSCATGVSPIHLTVDVVASQKYFIVVGGTAPSHELVELSVKLP